MQRKPGGNWLSLIVMAVFATGGGVMLTKIVSDNLNARHIALTSPQVFVAGIWWLGTLLLWIVSIRAWLVQINNPENL